MELLYLAAFAVIIYLLITNKSNTNEKFESLDDRLAELQLSIDLDRLKSQYAKVNPEPVKRPTEVVEPVKKPEPVVPTLPPIPPVTVERQKDVIADPPRSTTPPKKIFTPPPPSRRIQEPELSFFERHPDLEKFIGENLINKIGIAILVLAIGYFVKYAIDNNWIGPVGRVGIGIFCGSILIGIAHRMRNSYRSFSSVLVGGGLAVFYFTITLAYHQFHLFNQTTSFIILIVITCFAVALSILYDKQELAVIALVGGFASPFMVSSGNANYNALFIYLVILNVGLLIIAYYKAWRILNITAFGFTVIVFATVLFTLTGPTYITGFVYGTILYLLYFFVNIAHNVKENKKFIASDFTILLTNTALYFAVGLYLLTMMHQEQLRGLFSAALAVINLLLSYILLKNKKVDTNILYLLIGITLTFISLTAPIQLHGHNITLFWAAETVLLYWLYKKSAISLMKLTSLIIWCAMIVSLLLDWANVYGFANETMTIIANKGFITTLVAAISSYLLYILVTKDEATDVYGIRIVAEVYQYTALVLLFLSGFLEVNHQFLTRYPNTDLNTIYLMLYVPAFVYFLYNMFHRFAIIKLNWQVSVALFCLTITAYLLFNPQFFGVQYAMLIDQKISTAHFIAHWFGAIFIGLIFYRLIILCKDNMPEAALNIAAWALSAAIVLFLSMEVSLATNLIFCSKVNPMDEVETIYIKTGLPVLWGLLSFALMWLGMRNKVLTLRVISLTLFSVTLIKLFVFDIQNIPPAGKIAAFFCLGVLLLIISFMYQKLKKIIAEDETKIED